MKPRVVRGLMAAIAIAAVLADSPGAPCFGPGPRETLNLIAGETRVIEHVKPGTVPGVRIVDNPHALVVHGEEPGKLVILGAERGRWEIDVTLEDGRSTTYDVNVKAVLDPENRLAPATESGGKEDEGAAARATSVAAVPSVAVGTTGSRVGETGSAANGTKRSIAPGAAGENTLFAASSSAPAAASPSIQRPVAARPALATVQSPGEGPSARATYRDNPAIASSGGDYLSPSVSGGPNYLPQDGFSLMAGSSQIVDFPHRLRRISIADSSVADVQAITPYQLNLVGHKPGFTTLAVWDEQGHYEERQVRIDPTGKQQVMLKCVVAELNRDRIENVGINLAAALQSTGLTLVSLPGAVATPYSPQIPVTTQTVFGPVTSSQSAVMPPGGGLLPLLLSQNLTYGVATQNGQWATQTFFQVLEDHDLARILAQPNLLANSGEKAKFLSGGEIPIVIAQALNTSIVFKEFGTKVVFVPTVVGVREVELLVQPEVSEPDFAHGVQMFGFSVPAFVTRRAETMVRLIDGQTLVVAGLLLHEKRETVHKVPYLGDIPFAGALFRNTAYTNSESDLVISVTPEIVRPLPAGGQVLIPTRRGPLTSQEIVTRRLPTPDAARPRF